MAARIVKETSNKRENFCMEREKEKKKKEGEVFKKEPTFGSRQ